MPDKPKTLESIATLQVHSSLTGGNPPKELVDAVLKRARGVVDNSKVPELEVNQNVYRMEDGKEVSWPGVFVSANEEGGPFTYMTKQLKRKTEGYKSPRVIFPKADSGSFMDKPGFGYIPDLGSSGEPERCESETGDEK